MTSEEDPKRQPKGTFEPSTASRPTQGRNLYDLSIDEIKGLDTEETIRLCKEHRELFTSIHDSIISFYDVHNSISNAQLDTLKAFLLQHAEAYARKDRE